MNELQIYGAYGYSGRRESERCQFIAESTVAKGDERRSDLVTREGYAFTRRYLVRNRETGA